MKFSFIKLLPIILMTTAMHADISVEKTDNVLQINNSVGDMVVAKIYGSDHKLISKKLQRGNFINIEIPAGDGIYYYEIHAGDKYKGGMIKKENGKVVPNIPTRNHKKDLK